MENNNVWKRVNRRNRSNRTRQSDETRDTDVPRDSDVRDSRDSDRPVRNRPVRNRPVRDSRDSDRPVRNRHVRDSRDSRDSNRPRRFRNNNNQRFNVNRTKDLFTRVANGSLNPESAMLMMNRNSRFRPVPETPSFRTTRSGAISSIWF